VWGLRDGLSQGGRGEGGEWKAAAILRIGRKFEGEVREVCWYEGFGLEVGWGGAV